MQQGTSAPVWQDPAQGARKVYARQLELSPAIDMVTRTKVYGSSTIHGNGLMASGERMYPCLDLIQLGQKDMLGRLKAPDRVDD